MANEGYHEPIDELTDKTRDMHRAITSLMEELEALADRVAYMEDGRLRFILPIEEILQSTGQKRLARALPELLNRSVPV